MFRKLFVAAVIAAAPSIAHADGVITLADFSGNATVVDFTGGTTEGFGYSLYAGGLAFHNDAIAPVGSGFAFGGTALADNLGSTQLTILLGGSYQRVGFDLAGDQEFEVSFGWGPSVNLSLASYGSQFVAYELTSGISVINITDLNHRYDAGYRTLLSNLRLDGAIAPVPEPGEWAMMAAGLGIVGMASHRRKRKA